MRTKKNRDFILAAWSTSLIFFCLGNISSASEQEHPNIQSKKMELPAEVLNLASLDDHSLESLFIQALEPSEIPNGEAIGIHVLSARSQATLSPIIKFSTVKFWKGKIFDSNQSVEYDELKLFGIRVKAKLSIGNTQELIEQRYPHLPSGLITGDGRKSIIGNYEGNSGTAGKWIEEYREVKPGIWLGREFYQGKFWCYIVLDLNPKDRYDWNWVTKDDGTAHVIRADILIKAPIETVWRWVSDPSSYESFNSDLIAQVDQVKPGTPIHLEVRLGKGDRMTRSNEIIDTVDDANKAISWKRSFGFGLKSLRWQILVQEGEYVHYYTALRLPEIVGTIVDLAEVPGIRSSFESFAQSLKVKCEAPL